MHKNEKGFSHIALVALLVLTISAVGFTGYRIGQKNRSEQLSNSQNQDGDSQSVSEIKVDKEPAETVKIDKADEIEPSKPAPVEKESETKTTYENKKDDKVYLSITLQSAQQNGSKVDVHAKIEKSVSGTCNFKLYREGYEKVHTTKKITNSVDCKGQLDISSMPNYEGWSLHVWFDGDDGKTYAYMQEKPINLSNPN